MTRTAGDALERMPALRMQRAARTYGTVRALLQADGTPIGPLDTLIAGHALSLGMTLVTNNTREFSRVAGLRIENWISA